MKLHDFKTINEIMTCHHKSNSCYLLLLFFILFINFKIVNAQTNLPAYNFSNNDTTTQPVNNPNSDDLNIDDRVYDFGDTITKPYHFSEMRSRDLILRNTVIEIKNNGDLHFSSEATVIIGRGCTGTISGTLSLLFYNNNEAIICQINEPIWLNNGFNPYNYTKNYSEIASMFSQITNSKISYSTKIEIQNCGHHRRTNWPF
jgi:hypothetical protein